MSKEEDNNIANHCIAGGRHFCGIGVGNHRFEVLCNDQEGQEVLIGYIEDCEQELHEDMIARLEEVGGPEWHRAMTIKDTEEEKDEHTE